MRTCLLVLFVSCGVEPGAADADCDPIDLDAGMLNCGDAFVCCDSDTHCWSESADGTRYAQGHEGELVCDVCNVGAATAAYVCP